MHTINLILLFLALFGFLPLAIILYKKNRVKKILTVGLPATATVYDVRKLSRSAAEIVSYWFYAQESTKKYTGSLMIKQGQYKNGDTLGIYYLPDNPQRNTMNGAWGSPVIVVFGIVLALFVLFAVYKMYHMYQNGSL